MFALYASLCAAVLLVPRTAADDGFLWSSVAFIRAGDSTPSVSNKTTTLTPLGAEQLFSVGSFFRSRYIDGRGLAGLDHAVADDSQIFALALDEQYTAASGQAFMQGLYPPSTSNSSVANGTPVNGPLGGMSFARITTAGDADANVIYVAGTGDCPALKEYSENGVDVDSFTEIEQSSRPLYQSVSALLDGVIPKDQQNYFNAWAIYDYLNYVHTYNATAAAELDRLDVMEELRLRADSQQSAYLGNLRAVNTVDESPRTASVGSISTIAGASTASMVLDALTKSALRRDDSYQLSLIFGDFDPMMSLFALLGLPARSDDFTGLPAVGSALVFELYSTLPSANGLMPAVSDLSVRFGFRNGTDASSTLTAFPIFGRDAAAGDMSYSDFVKSMQTIALAGPDEWCRQCGSDAAFCAQYTAAKASRAASVDDADGDRNPVSNLVAGIIGGVIGLTTAGLVSAAIMLLGGVRLCRPQGTRAVWPKKSSSPTGFRVRGSRVQRQTPAPAPTSPSPSWARLRGSSSPSPSFNSEKSWGCAEAPPRPGQSGRSRADSGQSNTSRRSGAVGASGEEDQFRNMIHEPRRVRRANSGNSGSSGRFPVRKTDANVDRHGRCYPVGNWSNYEE